jgi:nucleoside-diphosphate-sugar epimerase
MIYGTDRDLNMHKLLKLLSKSPVYPIFGSGLGLMQPVHVQDLAAGLFASVMLGDKTVRKEYNLVGRYPLNYREIVREAAKALGRKIKLVSLPFRYVPRRRSSEYSPGRCWFRRSRSNGSRKTNASRGTQPFMILGTTHVPSIRGFARKWRYCARKD